MDFPTHLLKLALVLRLLFTLHFLELCPKGLLHRLALGLEFLLEISTQLLQLLGIV